MKQSIFKKEFAVNGRNGEVKAEVRVTMNYSTKNITGTNSATHDDFAKDIQIHKVEVFVNEKLWKEVKELTSEGSVLFETQKAKNEAVSHIQSLANDEPIKTFTDRMSEILDK